MFKRYVIAFIAVYLVLVIAILPAKTAWRWFGLDTMVSAEALTGTLWSGSAHLRFDHANAPLLPVDWVFKPGALLGGAVAFRVSARRSAVPVEFVVRRQLFGDWTITGVSGAIDTGQFIEAIGISALVGGTVIVDIEQIRFARDRFLGATGGLVWQDAVSGFSAPVSLGDLELTLTADNGALLGKLRDRGGPLRAEASFRLESRQWQAQLRLAARDRGNRDLTAFLSLLGPPGSDGYQNLQFSGSH